MAALSHCNAAFSYGMIMTDYKYLNLSPLQVPDREIYKAIKQFYRIKDNQHYFEGRGDCISSHVISGVSSILKRKYQYYNLSINKKTFSKLINHFIQTHKLDFPYKIKQLEKKVKELEKEKEQLLKEISISKLTIHALQNN